MQSTRAKNCFITVPEPQPPHLLGLPQLLPVLLSRVRVDFVAKVFPILLHLGIQVMLLVIRLLVLHLLLHLRMEAPSSKLIALDNPLTAERGLRPSGGMGSVW
ncbi:hypothetical protein FRX31_015172 [Thalictrum thalictroides]|uniref:Uncharacterized protein n=1 Tax=Thalictrum thalictroides TaxID=46969 RepID=A0A7J6WD25_THATH|nr:hypothetical protein FRX31_015172 [Thalictrum thalictroides]